MTEFIPSLLSWIDGRKREVRNLLDSGDPVGGLLGIFNEAGRQASQDPHGFQKSWEAIGSVMPEVQAAGRADLQNHPAMQAAGFLGTMAGIGAKTADLVKLAAAQKMEKAGTAPEKIWQATGWGRSPGDGQWRFEIPDNTSKLNPKGWEKGYYGPGTGAAVGFDMEPSLALKHDKLYKAYPDVHENSTIRNVRYGPDQSYGGSFEPESGVIKMNAQDEQGMHSGLLHELQHAIQQREGFARGGSPEDMLREKVDGINKWIDAMNKATDPAEKEAIRQYLQKFKEESGYDAYRRLAGEAEARMTQARMHLTPEERLANYPFQQGLLGYDVPVDQLITRFGKDGGLLQMSAGQAPKGGITAINNEFYKGGQFLPGSERTVKGAIQYPKSMRAGGKAEIEPGKWIPRPEDGMRDMRGAVVDVVDWRRFRDTGQVVEGPLFAKPEYWKSLANQTGRTVEDLMNSARSDIARFAQGARWVRDGQFFDASGKPIS